MNTKIRTEKTAGTDLDIPDAPAPLGDVEARRAAIRESIAEQSRTETREPDAKEFRKQLKDRNGE